MKEKINGKFTQKFFTLTVNHFYYMGNTKREIKKIMKNEFVKVKYTFKEDK